MTNKERVIKLINSYTKELTFEDVMIVLTVARTLKQIKDKKEVQA